MRLRKNNDQKAAEAELRAQTRNDSSLSIRVDDIIKNSDKAIELNRDSLFYGLLSAWWVTDVTLTALGVFELRNPDRALTYYLTLGGIALYDGILALSKRNRAREFERNAEDDVDNVTTLLMEKEKKG